MASRFIDVGDPRGRVTRSKSEAKCLKDDLMFSPPSGLSLRRSLPGYDAASSATQEVCLPD